MLNVGALHEGYVLDHIKAGKAMTIYRDLGLDKTDYPYKEALDMIDGDFFWIIAWDD